MRNPFAIPEPVPGALPLNATTSDPNALTWEKWDARVAKAYPIRYWLTRRLPIHLRRFWDRAWKTPLYWLRTHTYNRYHAIDLRFPRNGYKWGWIDRNRAVMFAAFAVLVAFVEKEYPGHVDWDHDDDIKARRDEFMTLYTWWTKERREAHDVHDALMAAAYGVEADRRPTDVEFAKLRASEEALDAKDQEMLHRLVNVRESLWT